MIIVEKVCVAAVPRTSTSEGATMNDQQNDWMTAKFGETDASEVIETPPRERDRERERDNDGELAPVKPRAGSMRPVLLGLGGLSLALGVAALASPRRVARLVGARNSPTTRWLLRAVGAREMVSGLGILLGRRPAPWLWARTTGDAIDLALLGFALVAPGSQRVRLGVTIGAIAAVGALDAAAARRVAPTAEGPAERTVRRAITIGRRPAEVYAFWRDLKNLPTFMTRLTGVEQLESGRTRWQAKGAAGQIIAWEAEVTEDVPNERLAWHSVPGSRFENSGAVSFLPAVGNRGTEVHVTLRFAAPGGQVGRLLSMVPGLDPALQLEADLRRLKQRLELGALMQSTARRFTPPAPPRSREAKVGVPAEVEVRS
jgi:uncharacterized membrane protein